jgi:hypothetical protein
MTINNLAKKNGKRQINEKNAFIATQFNTFNRHFKTYIEKHNTAEQSKRRRDIITIIGLFFTAAFTLIVAVAGMVQAYAFIKSERAFVAAIDSNFTGPLVVGMNPLPMYVDLQNSGKSTAQIKELSVAITHGPLAIQPEYGTAIQVVFPPIVAGGTGRRVGHFETGWGKQTIDAITAGTLKFYIYGFVRYDDVFDFWPFGIKETGFCFAYVPTGNASKSVFQTCQEPQYTYSK